MSAAKLDVTNDRSLKIDGHFYSVRSPKVAGLITIRRQPQNRFHPFLLKQVHKITYRQMNTSLDLNATEFVCAEIVPDPVGISGGVENIKTDKLLISLVGLPGLEPGTRPL